MFAGRRRRSSNVRVMQLFHELKQQFPTVPDHVVTSCIAAHASKETTIRQILETAIQRQQQEPMGRSPLSSGPSTPPPDCPPAAPLEPCIAAAPSHPSRTKEIMNNSDLSELKNDRNATNAASLTRQRIAKRPNHLDITPDVHVDAGGFRSLSNAIQPSEKCKNVHKLLNSPVLCDKPPRSPLLGKRQTTPNSPTKAERRLHQKETISTPTQTTDTLIGGNLNLSVNVNCSLDVVGGAQEAKRSVATAQVTPSQPWLQEPVSPRSYTTVNFTLRPPSAAPQPPIDITSHNSSLTYSTSSFDSQKGLQSRLQITVGPNGGSVSSLRTRPRSSYLPEKSGTETLPPMRAGSLNDLAVNDNQPSLLLRQEVRLEKLRIELKTEKAKLVIMRKEVNELEQVNDSRLDTEIEEQLLREIKHLRCQCEQLALEVDKKEFYQNIYTGQRGPLRRRVTSTMSRPEQDEGNKWNCHLCTFLNHPDLDKCEQCEMPRILHGKSPSQPNVQALINAYPPLSTSASMPNFLFAYSNYNNSDWTNNNSLSNNNN